MQERRGLRPLHPRQGLVAPAPPIFVQLFPLFPLRRQRGVGVMVLEQAKVMEEGDGTRCMQTLCQMTGA